MNPVHQAEIIVLGASVAQRAVAAAFMEYELEKDARDTERLATLRVFRYQGDGERDTDGSGFGVNSA